MRWIKHLTQAHKDPRLVELVEEMGAQAYGIYWILLEVFAAAMEPNCQEVPAITNSVSYWTQICRCSSTRTFLKFVDRATKLQLISSKTQAELKQNSSRLPAERLQICVPKLLKYRDEYSKKSGHSPDKLHTVKQSREQSREVLKETRKEKSELGGSAPPPPPTPAPPVKPPEPPEPDPDEDPLEWFRKVFTGEFPSDTWRTFSTAIATPEDFALLRANLAEWMRTKKYRNGFGVDAVRFLRSGIWKQPPNATLLPKPPKAAKQAKEELPSALYDEHGYPREILR